MAKSRILLFTENRLPQTDYRISVKSQKLIASANLNPSYCILQKLTYICGRIKEIEGLKPLFYSLNFLTLKDKILQYVNQVLDHNHFFITQVDVNTIGNHFKIFLDGIEGVGIDYCASISRQVSRRLDEDLSIDDTKKFTFEISSPGVDNILLDIRQFHKHIGRDITWNENGQQNEATLIAVGENNLELSQEVIEIENKKKKKVTKNINLSFDEKSEIENFGIKIKISFKKNN